MTYFSRIAKYRADIFPILLAKILQSLDIDDSIDHRRYLETLGIFLCTCLVDCFETRCYSFIVLPANKSQAIAYNMHDTQLNVRMRVARANRSIIKAAIHNLKNLSESELQQFILK